MSDPKKDPLSDLLSSFALGPSWARATGETTREKSRAASGTERPPREERGRDFRGGERGTRERRRDDRDHREDRGQRFQGRGRSERDRQGPPQPTEAPPAEGVRVTLMPDAEAVRLIGKEVHQVARVYPLFDVAKILLAERARCRAIFEVQDGFPSLFRGKLDDSIFLTREEALNHMWQSDLRGRFIEEETIEVDPPAGNFQVVARCGMSGEWLGPPNFHSYQTNLRRLHRERFSHVPFAVYSSKVRTERGEDAVNAWRETMKQKTRWRIKGEDEAWLDDPADALRALAARYIGIAFDEVRRAEVLASIPPANLSPSLMTSLKMVGNHARNHPAVLIPAVCKAVEAEHLPVFKRMGKLFTGPARPHPLPLNAVLAERPGIMVNWIRANKPAKLEGLWKAVLPEGSTAPPAEFAADLFWLLHQGHILLFTDDTLVVQDQREAQTPDPAGAGTEAKSRKKKKKKGARSGTGTDGKSSPPAEIKPDAAGDEEASPEDENASPECADEPPAAEDVADVPAEHLDAELPDASHDEPEPAISETETQATEPPSAGEDSVDDKETSSNRLPGVDAGPAL